MCARVIDHRKTSVSIAAAVLAVGGLTGLALAAGPAAAPTPPATQPAPMITTLAPAPATQPQPAPAAAANETFIGQVIATNVNVRSGPETVYYPVGQLNHGDLVKVMGTIKGLGQNWYRIEAPAGTRCYIARQFVKVGADGYTGTVTGNFINLHAASALTTHSSYAVIGRVRQGTQVSITGESGQYFIIRPPAGTTLYITAQFIRPAAADTVYVPPRIKMPNGFRGPGLPTLTGPATGGSGTTAAATTQAASTEPAPGETATTQPGESSSVTPLVPGSLPGGPATPGEGDKSIYNQIKSLNDQAEAEFHKPLAQETELTSLQQSYQDLLKQPQAPAFIKTNAQDWIKAIKNRLALQQLAIASGKMKPISATLAPFQKQWELAQQKLAQAYANSPYLAKGILETSLATHNYALVDPKTARVIAYLEPTDKIALAKLLGLYIGVKGRPIGKTGETVRIIKVATATLLPGPKIPGSATPATGNTPVPPAGN